MADIFVSYTSSDQRWAHWIAEVLKSLGHTPHVHEWEISGSESFYSWMEVRHDAADHVLCVISDAYLKAPYSTLERHAALWQAAAKRPGFVLLVVVEACRLPTLSDHLRRCELFGLPEDAARDRLRDFLARPAPPEPAVFPGQTVALANVPIHVPIHFLGREESLAAIRAALTTPEGRAAITALHGLRGVGKSTLAAAYAERHRNDYRATWWIRAQTVPTMRADLVALGVRLGWVAADAPDEPALAAVLERLRHEGDGILLIYDNALDARALTLFLPRGSSARVLITSNAHDWRSLAAPVEIRVWPKAIGGDFLIARTGRTAERTDADALSETLGGLPLAHEQAAAYCERLAVALAEYRRRFAARPEKLLDDTRHAPAEYHDGLTVAKTFGLAIEAAAELHPAAEPLIALLALLAPEPIPLFLLEEGHEHFDEPLATQLADDGLDEAIAALSAFALVERETIADERNPSLTTEAIRLHRLVREVAAMRLPAEAREEVWRTLVVILAAVYPSGDLTDPQDWPRARWLDALGLALVGGCVTIPAGAEADASLLLNQLALYRHLVLAAYEEAAPLYQRSLAIREKALGPDHPDVAATLNNLALLYRTQGAYTETAPLYQRSLAIWEKALGTDHPNLATGLNNLAELYRDQEAYAKAKPLYQRSLAICEKAFGPNHPNVAVSLNNLAELYRDQGAYTEAAPLYQRSLTILKKALGPNHPNVATSLNNLALLKHAQGAYTEAAPLYLESLAILEKVLGPDHPNVARSLRNYAGLLRKMDRVAEAEAMEARAATIEAKR